MTDKNYFDLKTNNDLSILTIQKKDSLQESKKNILILNVFSPAEVSAYYQMVRGNRLSL